MSSGINHPHFNDVTVMSVMSFGVHVGSTVINQSTNPF